MRDRVLAIDLLLGSHAHNDRVVCALGTGQTVSHQQTHSCGVEVPKRPERPV